MTRSGPRLRLRIADPGRAADADPPQHLTYPLKCNEPVYPAADLRLSVERPGSCAPTTASLRGAEAEVLIGTSRETPLRTVGCRDSRRGKEWHGGCGSQRRNYQTARTFRIIC